MRTYTPHNTCDRLATQLEKKQFCEIPDLTSVVIAMFHNKHGRVSMLPTYCCICTLIAMAVIFYACLMSKSSKFRVYE